MSLLLPSLRHLRTLPTYEAVVLGVLAFGPFVILTAVVDVIRRRADQEPSRHSATGGDSDHRRPVISRSRKGTMRLGLTAGAAAVVMLLAGCGSDGEEPVAEPRPSAPAVDETIGASATPSARKPTERPEPAGPVIEVEISGDRIMPNGQRIQVPVGQPVILNVTSDRAGEFHVHSSPEQTPAFAKGKNTIKLTIERPGLVDVEEHDSGAVVVQLEAR